MTLTIHGTGRLTADPEIRFSQAGKAIANCRIASNERRYNRDTNQWEDGDSTFIDVSLFGAKAEAVGEQLRKGQLVAVLGKLKSRQYDNRDGQKVTAYEIVADEIAPIVMAASSGGSSPRPAQQQGDPWAAQQPAIDTWAAQDQGKQAAQYDRPPF